MEKLRIIYSKAKEATYISNIDMIKIFEEALSRADIDINYLDDKSTKPDITIAHSLQVGIESTGEVAQIGIMENVDTVYFIKEINRVLPSGITVLTAEYIEDDGIDLISKVYAATYVISIVYDEKKLDSMSKKQQEDLKDFYLRKMKDYLSQQYILVIKKSKDRMERIDIKPQIKDFSFFMDRRLEVTIEIGEKSELKPEYIISGFNEYVEIELVYDIKRTKIFFE